MPYFQILLGDRVGVVDRVIRGVDRRTLLRLFCGSFADCFATLLRAVLRLFCGILGFASIPPLKSPSSRPSIHPQVVPQFALNLSSIRPGPPS